MACAHPQGCSVSGSIVLQRKCRVHARAASTVDAFQKATLDERCITTRDIDGFRPFYSRSHCLLSKVCSLIEELKKVFTRVYLDLKMTCRDNSDLSPDQPVYWRDRWEKGVTPWDCGCAHPLLVHLAPRLPSGRALVPGCGSGYDVIALAKQDPARQVTGLDLSELACKRGESMRDEAGLSSKQVQFIEGDFFNFDYEEPFDLVYDYTFFCALPPHLRKQWAARMAELVKPGGILFTLMFPVRDSGTGAEGGPPFSVSHEAYASVLEPAGFKLLECGDVPSAYRRPKTPSPGAELYGLWQRVGA